MKCSSSGSGTLCDGSNSAAVVVERCEYQHSSSTASSSGSWCSTAAVAMRGCNHRAGQDGRTGDGDRLQRHGHSTTAAWHPRVSLYQSLPGVTGSRCKWCDCAQSSDHHATALQPSGAHSCTGGYRRTIPGGAAVENPAARFNRCAILRRCPGSPAHDFSARVKGPRTRAMSVLWLFVGLLLACAECARPRPDVYIPDTPGPLLIAHRSVLIACCSPPTAHRPLLIAHCPLVAAHCLLPIAHCSVLIAHWFLPIAHCSLLTAHCSLPSGQCLLLAARN